MPLVILHHLLNVFVQLANKRGFKKKKKKKNVGEVSNNDTSPHAPELSVFIVCGQIVLQGKDVQTALISHIQNAIRRHGEGRNGCELGIGR
jgi:hypothetical protein